MLSLIIRLGSLHRTSLVPRQCLHRGAVMGVSDADFTSAKDRVGTLSEDPGNEVKLKMYALFKQVIKGGNV